MTEYLHRLLHRLSAEIPLIIPNRLGGIHGYVLAIVLLAVALGLRLLIAPVDAGLQYVTFFPAVAIAAVLGGFGPGLLNTVLGLGLATYIFIPPYYTISFEVLQKSFWGNLVFFLDGIVVSISIDAMHRYRQKFARELEESKKNELRIQLVNNELTARTQEIEKLNAELEKKANAADAANRAKSIFLANMSHEIRTPLHVIIGLGHMLNRSPANLEQRVEHLCATSEHLLALVNDILDMSKIEADQMVLDNSVFSLSEVAERLQDVIGGVAQAKNLTLDIAIDPRLHSVNLRGDPMRLTQVLINLGSNAIKFSHHGVIRIGIKILEQTDCNLRLGFLVQDNGIGIAPADQLRIFQSFEQVDDSTSRKYGGTGLGLSISQQLISLMGGIISVDSQPGKGSTFSFEITLSLEDKDLGTSATNAKLPVFPGSRVLVAEDHPLTREIMLDVLHNFGCLVDFAVDGDMAEQCARQNHYDLIFMDLQMPKQDGLAATRAIRTLPGYLSTPIIALSANTFAEDRQRCLAAGMNDHIGKPATPAMLAGMLAKWLPNLVKPSSAEQVDENSLSRALSQIPGLDFESDWLRTAELMTDYYALLGSFVKLHDKGIESLRKLLAEGKGEAAIAVAVELHSFALLIGARRIASLVTELLQVLNSGDDQVNIIATCEIELSSLVESIRALPELDMLLQERFLLRNNSLPPKLSPTVLFIK